MDGTFNRADKVGEIVARFPKASEVFKEYNIDFCCGGDKPLAAAINAQSLNENEVIKKLNQLYDQTKDLVNQEVDWREEPIESLIDHILNTHHVYMNKALPELGMLVTKILRAHGASHGQMLSKLHKLYHSLKMELEQHLIKEEEMLFPMIREYLKNPTPADLKRIMDLIKDTENEHDGAGDIIKEMRKITEQYTLPKDACPTYCVTYEKLIELEADIFQHIHLENNILFPRLKTLV